MHGQPVPVGEGLPRAGLLTHAHWALRVECRASSCLCLGVEMREGWYHGAVCFLPAAQRTIVRDTLALSGSPRVVHTAAGKW